MVVTGSHLNNTPTPTQSHRKNVLPGVPPSLLCNTLVNLLNEGVRGELPGGSAHDGHAKKGVAREALKEPSSESMERHEGVGVLLRHPMQKTSNSSPCGQPRTSFAYRVFDVPHGRFVTQSERTYCSWMCILRAKRGRIRSSLLSPTLPSPMPPLPLEHALVVFPVSFNDPFPVRFGNIPIRIIPRGSRPVAVEP